MRKATDPDRRARRRWAVQAHKMLLEQHGGQDWWPAEDRFEVMVGAILTQNTAWTNVEKAIANLKAADMLRADAIVGADPGLLARLIRPSGYFNVKARRLGCFCDWYVNAGGYRKLRYWPTQRLREALLGVHGVGPETADDILLYAFHRPVFVIDAYTRRIFARLGTIQGNEEYEELRTVFEQQLAGCAGIFAQFHALIVRHGKEVCRPAPRCGACCLNARCQFYQSV